jgi:hypothetical protein
MGTEEFTYSKLVGWSVVILTFLAIMIFAFSIDFSNAESILVIGSLETALISFLIYFCIKCFIPALKNKVALRLDAQKLEYNITGTVIYWRDVTDISWKYKKFNTFLSFKMADDSKTRCISISWLFADNRELFDIMQKYLKQAKNTAEKL